MATSTINRKIASISGTQLSGTLYTNNFRDTSSRGANMGTTTSIATATAKRYCATTLPAGVHAFWARASWANNSTGTRRLRITDSGGTLIHDWCQVEWPAVNDGMHMDLTGVLVLSAQTTIYVEVYQNSGGNLNLTNASFGSRWLR